MNSLGGGGNTEESGTEIKGHAVDGGWISAASELIEFLTPGYREDSNNGSRLARRGKQGSLVVETDGAEW